MTTPDTAPRRTMLVLTMLLGVLSWIPACADSPVKLKDLAASSEISLAEAVPVLSDADLILVGESHGNTRHHGAQLAVIRALHEAGTEVCVGLEMFQRREQAILDRWIDGNMSEDAMQDAFLRNWGVEWPAYRGIFLYCRDNNVPMAGLNVPREITRKVARQGFSSLTAEEIGLLPPIACHVAPEYESFLRNFTGSDGHQGAFERFCEAQLVWDAGMAVHALEYLDNRPGATMVVMTGSVHAWKPAMPDQIRRLAPEARLISILPEFSSRKDGGEPDTRDADYLVLGM